MWSWIKRALGFGPAASASNSSGLSDVQEQIRDQMAFYLSPLNVDTDLFTKKLVSERTATA